MSEAEQTWLGVIVDAGLGDEYFDQGDTRYWVRRVTVEPEGDGGDECQK